MAEEMRLAYGEKPQAPFISLAISIQSWQTCGITFLAGLLMHDMALLPSTLHFLMIFLLLVLWHLIWLAITLF